MGRAAARRVQPQDPVSFLIVHRVVEQGKWRRLNTMKHRAVIFVQPAESRAGPMGPAAADPDRTPAAE